MPAEESLNSLRRDVDEIGIRGEQEHAPSYIIPSDVPEMLRDIGPKLPEPWDAASDSLRVLECPRRCDPGRRQ